MNGLVEVLGGGVRKMFERKLGDLEILLHKERQLCISPARGKRTSSTRLPATVTNLLDLRPVSWFRVILGLEYSGSFRIPVASELLMVAGAMKSECAFPGLMKKDPR